MNRKALIGVVAVVIIVAAAAVAIGMGGGDDENKGFTGVVYDGNGGKTSNGDTTFRLTSETVYSSLFTNGDMVFDGWNTKADGTGTAYKPGDSISYPEHGYVTLYAQWAYGLNLSMTFGDCSYYLVNSEGEETPITLNGVPLPSDGKAGIAILAPKGTVWVDNKDGTFTGTNGNKVYRLTVDLENVDSIETGVNTANPAMVNIIFTYSGSVSGSVTYSTSSSSHTA